MGNDSVETCCGKRSQVYDSRVSPKGFIKRRRVCEVCDRRWTTAEIPEFRAEQIEALLDLAEAVREGLSLFPQAKARVLKA